MDSLEFSPDADDAWAYIIDSDPKLAEVVDAKLDEIEAGIEQGRMRQDRHRFVTLRVPGRDDLYVIVWERKQGHLYVLRVGKIQEA